MRTKKKRRGFTLTEMLCTVLIMSLVASGAVTGMTAMMSSYKKVLRASNAEELCNVIQTAMTGELTYAKNINVKDDGTLEFYSATYRTCRYKVSSDDGQLEIVRTDQEESEPLKVIAEKTYADGLRIRELKLTYDSSTQCVTVNLTVGSQTEDVTTASFVVQSVNMQVAAGIERGKANG